MNCSDCGRELEDGERCKCGDGPDYDAPTQAERLEALPSLDKD
jgi:hypothetical protein